MENKKCTLLDLFKNNMKVYVLNDGKVNVLNDRGDESLYRYNSNNNKIEYFNSSEKIWKETLNTFGWLSIRYFTEYIEPTYTIEDIIKNPDKVFVIKGEDNNLLYRSDGKYLYTNTISNKWTQSILSYNTIIEAEFIEYKGDKDVYNLWK